MVRITLSPVTDWTELGEVWRAVEARANCSLFQSWTWTGCRAEERFADPVLLRAEQDGRIVAMALFNRRRDAWGRETLFLGESGVAALDAVYIEHNGLLCDAAAPDEVIADGMRAARRAPILGRRPVMPRRIVLSGIGNTTLTPLRGGGLRPWVRESVPAPYIDLDRLRQTGRSYLDSLSGNTRYQLRRSDRGYAGRGDLAVRRAETLGEAQAFLAELAALHQASWTGRGRPGAFANPAFVRFHDTLLVRGFPLGEIELLRVAAGSGVVGILYNFRFRGGVLAYQSGFDYRGVGPNLKPGLTCHHQAIAGAMAEGLTRYDFLAGDHRYKRSLATGTLPLHWVELGGGLRVRQSIGKALGWFRARRADQAASPATARALPRQV